MRGVGVPKINEKWGGGVAGKREKKSGGGVEIKKMWGTEKKMTINHQKCHYFHNFAMFF